MKSAMCIMAVIAIMMRTAEAWSVERRGGITVFVRKKDASNKKNNNEKKNSIAREEGASYQLKMTDTLDDPKRMKIVEIIEIEVEASHLKRMSDTFTTAEDNVAIELESSSVAAIKKSQQAKKSSA